MHRATTFGLASVSAGARSGGTNVSIFRSQLLLEFSDAVMEN
jgi:hypothetical protein